MPTSVNLEILNRAEEIAILKHWLSELFERYALEKKLRFNIELALEEAVTNQIFYAYPSGYEGAIKITFSVRDRSVIITLVDEGKAFNPLNQSVAGQSHSIEDAPIGGRGIQLIKNYTDELQYHYDHGQNQLVMVFDH